MMLIGKTTARPAQYGHFQFFERRHQVVANAAGVGNGRILTDPDAFVNAMAEMFGELAVNISIDDRARLIRLDHEHRASRGLGVLSVKRRNSHCEAGHGKDDGE